MSETLKSFVEFSPPRSIGGGRYLVAKWTATWKCGHDVSEEYTVSRGGLPSAGIWAHSIKQNVPRMAEASVCKDCAKRNEKLIRSLGYC